jgi:hypothetical protein
VLLKQRKQSFFYTMLSREQIIFQVNYILIISIEEERGFSWKFLALLISFNLRDFVLKFSLNKRVLNLYQSYFLYTE